MSQMQSTAGAPTVGSLVRSWRERRHLSQLSLAVEAEISQKHLSFIESGRAVPSREMVLHLAEHLEVPVRERNALLMAAGYAPMFRDRPLDDPALARARDAIAKVLKAHEPFPALTVDRHWDLVSANAAVAPLLVGVDPELLKPPVNVMRIALHPRGLAPLTANLSEWRAHLIDRLQRQFHLSHDASIGGLLEEIRRFYPDAMDQSERRMHSLHEEIAVPLRLRTQAGVLSFFSTTTVFGTVTEITLSELSLEAFYPADDVTEAAMRRLVPPNLDRSG